MKAAFVSALLLMFAWVSPCFAQATNASLMGDYVVTGTETDGKPYDGSGPLSVTMDKSGALELKWDNGKYVGIGQVIGNATRHCLGRRGQGRRRYHGHQAGWFAGRKMVAPHRSRHQGHRSLEEEVALISSAPAVEAGA